MTLRFVHVVEVVAMRGAGQDRAAARDVDDGVLIVLADGAGGTGRGAEAAQIVVDTATTRSLAELDRTLEQLGGQTTAVVLAITSAGIEGASVGDSEACIVRGSEIEDLTANQVRKPLVGGGCIPTTIRGAALGNGTLVVASDGLWKYAKRADIARIATGPDLQAAAGALVELVRLRSGALQDDVSIVLCRER